MLILIRPSQAYWRLYEEPVAVSVCLTPQWWFLLLVVLLWHLQASDNRLCGYMGKSLLIAFEQAQNHEILLRYSQDMRQSMWGTAILDTSRANLQLHPGAIAVHMAAVRLLWAYLSSNLSVPHDSECVWKPVTITNGSYYSFCYRSCFYGYVWQIAGMHS